MYETIKEEDFEPLRRIVTEGGVIYELPESLVSAMYDAQDSGGIKILEDRPALDLEIVPRAEQGRLLLLVLKKVDDEVHDRRGCVEVPVKDAPDGRDEVARARLGCYVVAQGELDARDGVGGMWCEIA